MPAIRQLPQSVINKIAAGEVIERPASVVKELMENAVDADSSRVDVTIVKGGTELVRVVDDGRGIAQKELSLAVASHATSKIEDANDLFSVGTMGFRGEALASIAEVSRFVIRSRPAGAEEGAELQVDGGQAGPAAPCGMPPGTVVEVRDLFFNTPVRRKFLKTPQTEFGHATEAFNRIALAWPDRHFRLVHGERVVHELAPADRWKERIVAIFGRELEEVLIPVEGEHGELRLSGYVADPTYSRSHTRMQYLLLNRRYIRDRSLQHALAEAYRGLLLTGRYPVCFLQLEMPSEWVDVNVHPTKLEVRFQDSGRIYRHVLATLRSRFLATDLTARVGNAEPVRSGPPGAHGPVSDSSRATRFLVTESPQDLPWLPPQPAPTTVAPLPPTPPPILPRPQPPGQVGAAGESATTDSAAPQGGSVGPPAAPSGAGSASSAPRGMQLQNRYLITEDERGIVIIDQHALHERVLYESLRERLSRGKLEQQRLLVPATVHLRPDEFSALIQAKEWLEDLGIEIEAFGGSTVALTAYPAILGNVSGDEILRQVVEPLMAGEKRLERRDLLDEVLHMMACKAAVKAGDRLAQEEVDALLAQRHLCQDAHHCPHGRPTALVFTREQLDKLFQRT